MDFASVGVRTPAFERIVERTWPWLGANDERVRGCASLGPDRNGESQAQRDQHGEPTFRLHQGLSSRRERRLDVVLE